MEAPDYALLAAALAGLHEDYASTKRVLSQGGREVNPLLGEHPSDARLRNYFLGIGALRTGGAILLPKEISRPGLAGLAAMSFALARQNDEGKKREGFADVMKKPAIAGILAALAAHSLSGPEITLALAANDVPAITFTKKF